MRVSWSSQLGELFSVAGGIGRFGRFFATEVLTPIGGERLRVGNKGLVLAGLELGLELLRSLLLDLLGLFRTDFSQLQAGVRGTVRERWRDDRSRHTCGAA